MSDLLRQAIAKLLAALASRLRRGRQTSSFEAATGLRAHRVHALVASCEAAALQIETCIRCRLRIAARTSVAAPLLVDERFRPRGGWEADLDSESAPGSGFCVDHGIVGVGDSLHDREPEPDPIGRGAFLRAASLEGLEEPGEFAGRDHGPGVRDHDGRVAGGGVRGDVEPASWHVVTDGVLYQVRDEALDQQRVAGCSGGLERRGAPELVMIVRSQDFGGGRGEVDGLPSQIAVLAVDEGEQRLEQPLLPPAGGNNALAHLSHRGRVGVRVGERGLRERELQGDLAAQLVSGVGDEAPVRFARVTGERRQCPTAGSVQCGPLISRATFARVMAPCVTPTQASAAVMKDGAFRSTPEALIICPVIRPWGLGSGKSGMP